jgi:hypothetical protein
MAARVAHHTMPRPSPQRQPRASSAARRRVSSGSASGLASMTALIRRSSPSASSSGDVHANVFSADEASIAGRRSARGGAYHDVCWGSEVPCRHQCDAERRSRIQIPFAPPLSLSQCGPADAVRQSRHCGAGLGLVGDVRKGRAGYGRTRFGPVSLTGIDAVPLRQSADRWQRWPAAVRARSAAYFLVVRLSLRAVCAARSSPMADRVRSNASR